MRRLGLTRSEVRPLQDRLSGLALARLRLKEAPSKRRFPSGHERWEAVLESVEPFGGHVIHLRLDTPERVRSIDIAG